MSIDNINNEQDFKLKKPENLYKKEDAEDIKENTEASLESELNKVEKSATQYEQNLSEAGGIQAVQKIYSEMDLQKKNMIQEKIKKYAFEKKNAIKNQKGGVALLNPIAIFETLSDPAGIGTVGAAITFPVMYPMAVIMTPFYVGANTFNRIASSIKLNREKRNLSKIEKQYQ